jgi:hypothetical protein
MVDVLWPRLLVAERFKEIQNAFTDPKDKSRAVL